MTMKLLKMEYPKMSLPNECTKLATNHPSIEGTQLWSVGNHHQLTVQPKHQRVQFTTTWLTFNTIEHTNRWQLFLQRLLTFFTSKTNFFSFLPNPTPNVHFCYCFSFLLQLLV